MGRLKKLINAGYICIIVFLVMSFIGYCDSENMTFSMLSSFTASGITYILIWYIIYTEGKIKC